MHPLAVLLHSAAAGRPPAADGGWHRVPPWRPGLAAVVAFTGHAVLALEPGAVAEGRLELLGVDGVGGAHHPRVLTELAGDGWIDNLDLVVAARGVGGGGGLLVERPDLAAHPRAQRAAALRDDLRVLGLHGDDAAVLVLARGIAGLTEVSLEVAEERRGRGLARGLVRAALAEVPAGELLLGAVAPGNVASLRAFLGAGFAPLASVQLFAPEPSRRSALPGEGARARVLGGSPRAQ